MVKDWQVDPVSGALLHVDLVRVAMDVRIQVKVPVHTFGEPQGVKLQGGVFEMVTREVEIECLPSEIPGEFRVDVTELMIGKQLRAGDITLDPEKMKLVTDPQRVLAHVVALNEEEKPGRRLWRRKRRRRARSHQEGQEGNRRRRRGRGRRRPGREEREEGQGEVAGAPWAGSEESGAPVRDSERDVSPA